MHPITNEEREMVFLSFTNRCGMLMNTFSFMGEWSLALSSIYIYIYIYKYIYIYIYIYI